jgi:hypothetical protein
MPASKGEGQPALSPSQLTLSTEDAQLLERLCEMMQRADVATVRAAAHLAASVLAAARAQAEQRG